MLPRAIPDPANLHRLRAQALRRLQQEERTIARRTTLQRLGLVFSGMAILRGKRALAGPRCVAPQYGAPGFSARTPLIPPPAAPPTRDDLKSLSAWTKSGTAVVPNSAPVMLWSPYSNARTISYRLPSGEILSLSLISDAKSGISYIVRANEAFYASDGTDLLGCRFLGSELIVVPSIFKMPTPPDGDAGVVARFAAKVDDKALAKAASPTREARIDLSVGVQTDFWADTSKPNSGSAYPFLYTAGVTDGVLQFSGSGTGPLGHRGGTFWVDLKAKKLIKYVPAS
jgi:hypothetical protein